MKEYKHPCCTKNVLTKKKRPRPAEGVEEAAAPNPAACVEMTAQQIFNIHEATLIARDFADALSLRCDRCLLYDRIYAEIASSVAA